MDINEFSVYVINNMSRATIGNALNIVNKFTGSEPEFKFEDFIAGIESYTNKLMSDNYNKNVCYKIFVLIDKTMTKYKSNIKYNKTFVMNDFIINLWRIMNGH